MESTATEKKTEHLRALPGDDVRQILWRFADRYDLQMLVQSVRAVARGPVARLVAQGPAIPTNGPPRSRTLLQHFDESGITGVFMEPDEGGFIEGPKNLALALVAFELAWVDAGAATGSLAGCLALSPIHERGTPEQRELLHEPAAPPPSRAKTAALARRVLPHRADPLRRRRDRHAGRQGARRRMAGGPGARCCKWKSAAASSPTWASPISSPPPWIPTTRASRARCMVILEETDPGIFDRGMPTRKLVHQLSSTRDPIFSLRVPASRIIGGYTVKDGVIVPRYSHGEIIEAVFRRTRVTVGVMTVGQAALRHRAGDPLSARALPRRRGGRARLAALRSRPAAEGGRRPPAGGRLGHRRSQRLAGFRGRAPLRPARSAGAQKDEILAARGIDGGTAA